MIEGGWFTETLHSGLQQRIEVDEILFRQRTAYQDLVVFKSRRVGRVLALDGVVQTTEADEFAYHEMLAHVPLIAHGAAERVAIVGGGDGGALREVLKHPVERAVMIEIDRGVVDICREHMPMLSDGAFDDPRTDLVIADGVAFMRETDQQFDVIVVDSTDPVGPAVPLFSGDFYRDCAARLTARGILIVQSGVSFVQPDEARATYHRLRDLFADAALYVTQVPTYSFGYMTLGWGCNSPEPRRTPGDTIAARCAALELRTRYYSPDVHTAAFCLPPYIQRAAKGG